MIRAATPNDIPAIAAIYAPFVISSVITFELEPPSQAEMRGRWQALVEADFPYLVAEAHGEVLGYAYAGPFRTRPAYNGTCESSVYLGAAARRKGIGSALMRAVMAKSAARGLTQMIAVITDAPETAPSLAFHTALGFARVGTLKKVGRKFERDLDVALLQTPLCESGA